MCHVKATFSCVLLRGCGAESPKIVSRSVPSVHESRFWVYTDRRTDGHTDGRTNIRFWGGPTQKALKGTSPCGCHLVLWRRLFENHDWSMDWKWGRFSKKRPLDPKSSGNGSIGIDLTSKKEIAEKYLFFFENELVKVENCWNFDENLDFFEIPLRFPL